MVLSLFRVLHDVECAFPTFVRVLKCSVDVDVAVDVAANNSNVVLGIVVSVQLEDTIADDGDDVDVVMVVGYP